MNKLSPDDPRHGTENGYVNLECRCQPCRDAHAEVYRQRQVNVNVGHGNYGDGKNIFISVPLSFHDRFKAYAESKGRSMRSLGMEAITKLMEESP